MTSNPTIFEKAITGSADYDDLLRQAARAGMSPAEIFEALAVRDIRDAADVLRPVYERLDGVDGYVSLEVSPHLAHDTEGTIADAERLWRAVERPNVMIKIPGTEAGLPAISATLAKGINVNVTLLFDVDRYEQVADAYMEGLERYAAGGREASPADGWPRWPASSSAGWTPWWTASWSELPRGGPAGAGRGGQRQAGLRAVRAPLRRLPLRALAGAGGAGCSASCGPAPAPRTRPTRT